MKTKNRSAHSGLTATRFADYAYRLPGFDAESNVVYRADERRGFPEEIRRKRKVLFKMFDFKQIIAPADFDNFSAEVMKQNKNIAYGEIAEDDQKKK